MEVLLIDDHPVIHELFPELLRKAFGDVTVIPATDLETAFQRLAHHKAPDLALLDLGLPGHSGLDTLRRFRWKFPSVPVVVISSTEDVATVRVAQGMGVSGYVFKTATPDETVNALKQIQAGGKYFPESAAKDAPNKSAGAESHRNGLSPR
jgi:DNA-binding NarL/FixJ family response regulator